DAIRQIVAERRGTAPGRRARSVDELAHLLDRAGDLTIDELSDRVASAEEKVRGNPLEEMLTRRRAIALPFAGDQWRFVLTESYGRYAAAFGKDAMSRVRVSIEPGSAAPSSPPLIEMDAREIVPETMVEAVITPTAARREILTRYVALAGPTTVREIVDRYGWNERWIEDRLTEWQRTGKLVRGKFRAEVLQPEWCSRRIAEIGRRKALAALRRQIEAVELNVFAELVQRWQHVEPRERLSGPEGVAAVLRQLYGLARPAKAWERDYLRVRLPGYDPVWLSQFVSSGEPVWVGDTNLDPKSDTIMLTRLRFFARGTGSLWLGNDVTADVLAEKLSEQARVVLRIIEEEGASFTQDLEAVSGFTTIAVKESLRELVAAGLVTNDTIEAMREIVRWRPLGPRNPPDPTRWLPADYSPSANRKIVQRRPNLRRLPKWRRPDKPGVAASAWSGRWSLVRRLGTLGRAGSEEDKALQIARYWLDRYGLVSRECWRREKPPLPWRTIYRELKRLEFRGEVRRGYFVKGLGGAQFASVSAVELLRAIASEEISDKPFVLLAASDPANVYNFPLDVIERDPLSRPRGAGALLVTRGGRVAISVEGRGRRIAIAEGLGNDEVMRAKELLAEHLRGEKGARYLMLPDIRPT
ncbi:MAG TPA: hypothetical protein VM939_14045, partial [Gemmatimonadaceae bacterium]|nr:hypothetical protein [Gemmatimonadaceae bacterium]